MSDEKKGPRGESDGPGCPVSSMRPAGKIELPAPAGSEPVLRGEWRHSHGMIFCGTLRIAKGAFDTNPHPDFCARVFDDICETMNKTQNNATREKGQTHERTT